MAKPLSIEESLTWTQRFAMREWKLLFPVAFAFLALPQLAMNLLIPAQLATGLAGGSPAVIMPLLEAYPWLAPLALLIQFIALIGALAIVALALVPRISVREAIGLALRRVPIFIAAIILIALAVLAVTVVGAIVLGLARLNVAYAQAILVGVILGLCMILSVRLITLAPVVVASRAGPIAAIMLAWELSAGAFWRLLGAAVVYAIGGLIVVFASAFALGTIFVLGARAAGAPDVGADLSAIYLRLAVAVFGTGFHILAVALYRQLGGSIRGT